MPKPYPKEFREDGVRVARNREPGVHLKQIAADFGISESCPTNWMKTADVEDGVKPGVTASENTELREARKRLRLLEQEKDELRRAAAYLSQAGERRHVRSIDGDAVRGQTARPDELVDHRPDRCGLPDAKLSSPTE